MYLSFSVQRSAGNRWQTCSKRKVINWKTLLKLLEIRRRLMVFLLRTTTCFNISAPLKSMIKPYATVFPKYETNFDDVSRTQLAFSVAMICLGVLSSPLSTLPAILASASGARDFLTTIFTETFKDVWFIKAFEKSLSLTTEQKNPLDGTQKN